MQPNLRLEQAGAASPSIVRRRVAAAR